LAILCLFPIANRFKGGDFPRDTLVSTIPNLLIIS